MNNKQQPEATNKIQSAPNYLSDNYHSEMSFAEILEVVESYSLLREQRAVEGERKKWEAEKKFSHDEVESLMKTTLTTTVDVFQNWLVENTDVVDIDTQEMIDNCEITLKANAKSLIDAVYSKLEENNIIIRNGN